MKVKAVIGLGSNQEDPVEQIRRAFTKLSQLPDTQLMKQSPLYKSKAMLLEDAAEQPDYINAVALLDTGLSAHELLLELHRIEDLQGRVRTERWGARTLDLDILTYGNQQINEPELQIPHKGIAERNFVLYPLQAMMGDEYNIPGKGNIAELVKQCSADGLEKLTEKAL